MYIKSRSSCIYGSAETRTRVRLDVLGMIPVDGIIFFYLELLGFQQTDLVPRIAEVDIPIKLIECPVPASCLYPVTAERINITSERRVEMIIATPVKSSALQSETLSCRFAV